MEHLDYDRKAWEDSGLPSLRMESQVKLSGKYYLLTTNRPCAIGSGSFVNNQQGREGLCVTCESDHYQNTVRVVFPYLHPVTSW